MSFCAGCDSATAIAERGGAVRVRLLSPPDLIPRRSHRLHFSDCRFRPGLLSSLTWIAESNPEPKKQADQEGVPVPVKVVTDVDQGHLPGRKSHPQTEPIHFHLRKDEIENASPDQGYPAQKVRCRPSAQRRVSPSFSFPRITREIKGARTRFARFRFPTPLTFRSSAGGHTNVMSITADPTA
jgi:hypothetical protein